MTNGYSPPVTASRIRICAVAAFVALVAGACGSGGDDGTATGAKGGYVAKIDPICAELQGKIGELGQEPAKKAADIEAAVARRKAIPGPKEYDKRTNI